MLMNLKGFFTITYPDVLCVGTSCVYNMKDVTKSILMDAELIILGLVNWLEE